MNRPDWVVTYAQNLQLDENWADDVISTYDTISTIHPHYPHRILSIDINSLRDDALFMEEIHTSSDHSIITMSLLYLDLLDSFTNNIPQNDTKLYNLFNKIQTYYTIDIDFPEFYEFCRKLEHIHISTVPDYKILQAINETKILQKSVAKNSIWNINYKNTELKVKIMDFVDPMQLENIVDQNILAKICESNGNYAKGETIHLKPKHINAGKQIG